MRNLTILLFPLFLAFTAALPDTLFSQDLNTIDLSSGWAFREQGSTKWYPAKVPGSVQMDLYLNKLIPDPFFRDNESKIQWVSDTGWVYEKTFDLEPDFFANRNIDLVFEGLDTYANIYLNDSLILATDNMFKTYYAQVKRFLVIGKNRLRIEFPSVTRENKARYDRLPYKLPGDEKVMSRKAAYQFGWDWGPRIITMGIWKPIHLRYYTYVNVLGVRFIQKSLTDSLARMSALFTVTNAIGDSGIFRLNLDGETFKEVKMPMKKGPNNIRVDFEIKDPRRWWPSGMGEQNMYNLGYSVIFAGQLAGQGVQRIGLRTVELVQGVDSTGRSFFFRVNGIPVFAKGANYVPMDNLLSRVSDSMVVSLIHKVKDANMNMIRVWGGGIYESDRFYDLCDENGIMVWQDFMFACAMYPGDKEFLNNVRDETLQQVVRLRRHPSIVLWCGNNEIDEGWHRWGWQKQYGYTPEDSLKIYGTYRAIFRDILLYNVSFHDTLRPYIMTSPRYGWGDPESMRQGDSHYWGVWWGKEPFEIYRKKTGRFMSEYGFQGFPDYSTIKKFTNPEDRKLGSAVMKAHQKHPVGYETIREYMERDFRVPATLPMYAYVSQALQAEGVGIGISAHRRAKPYCMGSLFWQLNDCWPVVSWSAIDYYGKPKALYYTAKRLFANDLVSAVTEGDTVRIYGITDGRRTKIIDLKMTLYDFAGNKLSEKDTSGILIPKGGRLLWHDSRASLLAGRDTANVLLYTQISDSTGTLSYDILYFARPKDQKLQKPIINKTVTTVPEGYSVTLTTDRPARYVYLELPGKGDLSDNYFDLLPGIPHTVIYRTGEKNLRPGEQMKIISLYDSYQP